MNKEEENRVADRHTHIHRQTDRPTNRQTIVKLFTLHKYSSPVPAQPGIEVAICEGRFPTDFQNLFGINRPQFEA